MDRLILFLVACTAQVGCQAPVSSLHPFANFAPTRVPPPPTGVVGRPGYYPPAPAALPPNNTGASTYSPTSPGHYWQPAADANEGRTPVNSTFATDRSPTSGRPIMKSDRLTWLDPQTKAFPGPLPYYEPPLSQASPSQFMADIPVQEYQPRLLPRTGPVQSLPSGSFAGGPGVSPPPRIRGFVNSGVQPLRVPAELVEFQNGQVRQASAGYEWTSRDRY